MAQPGAPASGAPLGADLRCRTAGTSWLLICREGPNAMAATLLREGGESVPPLSTAFSPRNQRLPHLTRSSAVPRPHGARETRCKCDQGVKGFLRVLPGRRQACRGQLPRLPTACLGSMPAYPGQHARIPGAACPHTLATAQACGHAAHCGARCCLGDGGRMPRSARHGRAARRPHHHTAGGQPAHQRVAWRLAPWGWRHSRKAAHRVGAVLRTRRQRQRGRLRLRHVLAQQPL